MKIKCIESYSTWNFENGTRVEDFIVKEGVILTHIKDSEFYVDGSEQERRIIVPFNLMHSHFTRID